MRTIFAVHHVFDLVDYNEHHYFTSFIDAFDMLMDIRRSIEDNKDIVQIYESTPGEYSVQLKDGIEKVYIQEFKI